MNSKCQKCFHFKINFLIASEISRWTVPAENVAATSKFTFDLNDKVNLERFQVVCANFNDFNFIFNSD